MRILYTTTIGLTMIFFRGLVKQLIEAGHTVDIAANEDDYQVDDFYRQLGCKVFQVNWQRSPLKTSNLKAIKKLKSIISDGNYDIVHCHTPVAGFCTRYACRKLRKQGLRVFYTAHGFHFFSGAPAKNWLLYYPIEKISAHWTDVLITINKEDYQLACKSLKAKQIKYVPGVGIDVDRIKNTKVNRAEKRKEFGFSEKDFVFMSTGELSKRKNHQTVVKALNKINDDSLKYLIVGEGAEEKNLITLSQNLGVDDRIVFAGYRKDVAELLKSADAFAFPSTQEGLPVALMEAIAAGLPVVCSKIRGNVDLLKDGFDFVYDCNDSDGFASGMQRIIDGEYKPENVVDINLFDTGKVNEIMLSIYNL